ncbi:unnamed protein product, partial [marine sediment metagenome]
QSRTANTAKVALINERLNLISSSILERLKAFFLIFELKDFAFR